MFDKFPTRESQRQACNESPGCWSLLFCITLELSQVTFLYIVDVHLLPINIIIIISGVDVSPWQVLFDIWPNILPCLPTVASHVVRFCLFHVAQRNDTQIERNGKEIVGGLSRGEKEEEEEEEAAAASAARFVCRGAKKLEIVLLTNPIRNRNLYKTEKNK